jgi:uncharacterized protein (TIGR00730 family)
MISIKAVAVYCGSRKGADPKYVQAAYRLGQILAQHDVRLVFGGGSVGLMGAVSDGVADHKGDAIGVITDNLVRQEVANNRLPVLEVVPSMHERKQRMFELADAFVVLPGGAGTLDEMFEILTWKLLRLHDRPIVLVDQDGYWQPLLKLIERVIEQGFAAEQLPALYTVVGGVEDVLPALSAEPPPAFPAQPKRT